MVPKHIRLTYLEKDFVFCRAALHLCDVSSDFLYEDLFGGPFFKPFLTRRDSDGREKAEAYGAEEAGRQSGKRKLNLK